jgi:DNA-binding transcriptional LysR family regulator
MEAEVLYPKAVSILEDLCMLEDEISSVGKSVSGELIIGASTIPSAFILPKLAAEFKKQYPKVSFEIRTYDSTIVAQHVENHELYLGIVGAEIPSSKLQYQPFAEDTLHLIASSSRKNKKKITLEELKNLDFLLREEGSGTRKSIEQSLLKKNVTLNQLQTCAILGSSTAIKEAVQSNLGVSIISGYAIKNAVAAKLIDTIELEGVSMKRSFFIVTPKKRSLPNHYNLFLNHLLEAGS